MSIQDIRAFLESDLGFALSFISLLSWCISAPFLIIKRFKQGRELLRIEKTRNIIRDILIHCIFITFGIVIPLLILIFTWHLQFSILWLFLQILALYAMISYAILMYILIKVLLFLKKHGA